MAAKAWARARRVLARRTGAEPVKIVGGEDGKIECVKRRSMIKTVTDIIQETYCESKLSMRRMQPIQPAGGHLIEAMDQVGNRSHGDQEAQGQQSEKVDENRFSVLYNAW